MKLSIIVSVYNEESTIRQTIQEIQDVKIDIDKEIIIVDDGSTDSTRKILEDMKKTNIIVIHHNFNKGKGAALKTALKYVTGDIVIIQDADLEIKPKEYPKLISPIIKGETEVVYGSRFLQRNPNISITTRLVNKLMALLTNLLFGTHLTDETTCYQVLKTKLFKNLNLESNDFSYSSEITAKIARRGIKIKEIPISYNPRPKYARSNKKMKYLRDGPKSAWALIKYKFINQSPFKYKKTQSRNICGKEN